MSVVGDFTQDGTCHTSILYRKIISLNYKENSD